MLVNGLKDVLRAYPYQYSGITSMSVLYYSLLNHNDPTRVYNPDHENSTARTIRFWNVVFWGIIMGSTLLVLLATMYHVYLKTQGFEEYEIRANRNPNIFHREQGTTTQKVFLGFSLLKTWEKLCDTRSTHHINALTSLRGFKFIFILWIAFGSYMYWSVFIHRPVADLNDYYSHQFWFVIAKSLYTLVDCLLWVSGVYTGFGYMIELNKRLEGNSNPELVNGVKVSARFGGLVILYKILKLLPIVLLSILLYGWGAPVIGNGPVFSEKYYFMTRRMKKYWWTYMLFINNLHPSIRNQGMIWGSFFALELQLCI